MIKDIITLLKEDTRLMTLINGTAAKPNIYPLATDYLGDCIVYDYSTVAADKITEVKRLELNIIAATLNKTLDIEKAIKRVMLTLGDYPLNERILQVEVNGGGSLYDNERMMNHRILIFNIITRSEE